MLAVAAAAIAIVLVSGSREVRSSVDPEVVIRCPAATSAEGCVAWGDRVLAAGAPSTTFDMEDLVRVELRRGTLGIGESCEAAYVIGRYPDEPVWDETVDCLAE